MKTASFLFHGMALLAMGILASGCSDPAGIHWELVPGLIHGFDDGDPRLSLGVNGNSLTIEVVTYGNSCREKGELRVTVSQESRLVSISPFDWLSSRQYCQDILNRFHHSAVVDLEEMGTWTFALFGENGSREPVQSEHTVDLGS